MTDPQFSFGTVLTAAELEGVASTADWHHWIARGRAPHSGDGAGFRSSWRDDLTQMAELGLDEIAVTLEWARLWPEADRPDEAEIEFRRDLLRTAASQGMEPWACLVDGTLPGWFVDDERGFTDDRARRLIWPRHVDWVGETFGDLVAGWVPIREPRQRAAWGHLVGATPPGRQRRRDTQKMVDALAEAELEAERLLRGSGSIATFLTGRRVIGAADDVKAGPHARWLDEHLSSRWLRELAEGRAREAFDRVVVQLRSPIVVDGEGSWHATTGGARPESLLDGLASIIDHVGDRAIVAAGDLADVPPEGEAGVDHLQEIVAGATELGAQGWWQTSPIDGWHWQHGFSRTPGLFDRDRNRRGAAKVIVEAVAIRNAETPPT